MAKEKSGPLCILGFSLALGITWGLLMIFAGWTGMFGWGHLFVKTMRSVYIGYTPTFFGGIIGGLWGFVYGFIIGAVFSFFYNLFRR